jgi:signal peptidase I
MSQTSLPEPKRSPKPPPPTVVAAALGVWKESRSELELPISGRSMFPMLREGNRITIRTGTVGLKLGDIAVFRRGREVIAHRVLHTGSSHGKTYWITQGDQCSCPDSVVYEDQVIGRVVGIWRAGQYTDLSNWNRRWAARCIALSARTKNALRRYIWKLLAWVAPASE